ncbi:hypothetical protein ATANTOWER_008677 [Ataeniobius toweri]|uniref:Uncharacterized protein n=1 Tax=Ataeniobius toweri TaxID=208326 RepID=A0ABU7A2Z8_9TELE|nr:hypothetical protein [Ataeniobius toweri]
MSLPPDGVISASLFPSSGFSMAAVLKPDCGLFSVLVRSLCCSHPCLKAVFSYPCGVLQAGGHTILSPTQEDGILFMCMHAGFTGWLSQRSLFSGAGVGGDLS